MANVLADSSAVALNREFSVSSSVMRFRSDAPLSSAMIVSTALVSLIAYSKTTEYYKPSNKQPKRQDENNRTYILQAFRQQAAESIAVDNPNAS
jgi:hypothetical protein